MTNLLHHYIGTGLKGIHTAYESEKFQLVGIKKNSIILYGDWSGGTHHTYGNSEYSFQSWKPLMLPLSCLSEPITVEGYNDGKEFVPAFELIEDGVFTFEINNINELPFWKIQKLISWHFWIGPQGLFGKQIIDKRIL